MLRYFGDGADDVVYKKNFWYCHTFVHKNENLVYTNQQIINKKKTTILHGFLTIGEFEEGMAS